MSDKEFGGNDDLSLPKATVQKIINEVLSGDHGMSFAKESRDLLIECCVEFITMISSEANEIAEKDAKKTIACEHITKALEDLGFAEYVPDIQDVAQQFKTQQVTREKKQSKIEQSGLTEEELLRQQEELFRSATQKFNAGPGE
ncbi:negative cofactor 2 complex subunit beta [Sphaceloma murrayae]|uniref:NCT transcriptional regulatory complex subunit B n=1 Tax=Sphaceloma murrayae TaxID=2082308 RepID=A0A2K1QKY2_9PEZI|nr:negative cofactor 2 complex subunit beta [Sphaceloma murrayae]